jgi:sarcosine oxidase, subunit beta
VSAWDVAVVGGGVVGVSIAYHLAAAGCERVIVLEQGQVGGGSSLRAAGGIRRQFSTRANIAWSQAAHERFGAFHDEFAADPGFRRCGYLVLASDEPSTDLLAGAVGLQRELGVPVETLDAAGIRSAFPDLDPSPAAAAGRRVRLGAWTEDDGYVDVGAVLAAIARAAREAGAVVREGCGVRAIDVPEGRVQTDDGPLYAGATIVAAGAWSGRIGRLAGVDIPVAPLRREMWRLRPLAARGPLPWTIDLDGGFYFRPDDDGIVASGALSRSDGLATHLGRELPRAVRGALEGRLPAAACARERGGWAGSVEVTPDGGALIGPHPDADGLWLACGFSGHGFMHSLVAGAVMAEWLLDGKPSAADPHPFRAGRFVDGGAAPERLHQRPPD